jgi:hypothetical protein
VVIEAATVEAEAAQGAVDVDRVDLAEDPEDPEVRAAAASKEAIDQPAAADSWTQIDSRATSPAV